MRRFILTKAACPAFALIIAATVPGLRASAGPMLTIQFGSAGTLTSNNNTFQFPAQHPAGWNWETTGGRILLTVVAGDNGNATSAALTVTGVDAAHPLMIIYDGSNPANPGGDNVSIAFSGSGFDIFNNPAVPGNASLDGSVVTFDPLATGVSLQARANGTLFATVNPANAKGKGAFNGASPNSTGMNHVASLSGLFTFGWDPVNNVVSDHVDLPNSADITVYGDASIPEPPSVTMAMIGLLGVLGNGRRRRYWDRTPTNVRSPRSGTDEGFHARAR